MPDLALLQESEDEFDPWTEIAEKLTEQENIQLDSELNLGSLLSEDPKEPKFNFTVPGFVNTAAKSLKVAGSAGSDGKEAIIDANDSEQFLDERTERAQTRPPYNSTLLQLDGPKSYT